MGLGTPKVGRRSLSPAGFAPADFAARPLVAGMTLGPAAAGAAGPELEPGIPGAPGAAAPGREVLPLGVSTPVRPWVAWKARASVSLMAASSKTDLGCSTLPTA